jgi:hypothetical protein
MLRLDALLAAAELGAGAPFLQFANDSKHPLRSAL